MTSTNKLNHRQPQFSQIDLGISASSQGRAQQEQRVSGRQFGYSQQDVGFRRQPQQQIDIGVQQSSAGRAQSEEQVSGGLLSRIFRWGKSEAHAAMDAVEDAKKIIKQTMREMADEIPKRQAELNGLGGMVTEAANKVLGIEKEIKDLTAQAESSLKLGNRERATILVGSVAEQEGLLAIAKDAHANLKAQYETTKGDFDVYVATQQKTIREHQALLNRAAFAELRGDMAKAMEKQDVGSHAQTLEEMRAKLGLQAATNEVTADNVMKGAKAQGVRAELDMTQARGAELLAALEQKVGGAAAQQ